MHKMIYYPLAGLLATSACTAHRQSVDLRREQICLEDSALVSGTYGSIRLERHSLKSSADSVKLLLEADSAVTSTGTRIYRPRIRRLEHAPRTAHDINISARDTGQLHNSVCTRVTKTEETHSAHESEARTAVIPRTYGLALAAIMSTLAIYAWRKRSTRT